MMRSSQTADQNALSVGGCLRTCHQSMGPVMGIGGQSRQVGPLGRCGPFATAVMHKLKVISRLASAGVSRCRELRMNAGIYQFAGCLLLSTDGLPWTLGLATESAVQFTPS